MSEPSSAPPVPLPCPQCGYDLRAIEQSARCPECGWEIDRTGLAISQIPWSFRGGSMGWMRAYWRTVRLGAWRVGRLADEIDRPVGLRDVQRFATITALLAALPYAIFCVAAVIAEGGTAFLNPLDLKSPTPSSGGRVSLLPPAADARVPYAAGMTRWFVLPAGIVMFAWMCTRMTAWWFRARRGDREAERARGDRAAALSYYTSAALVTALIAMACLLAGLGADSLRKSGSTGDEWLLYVIFGTASALIVLTFVQWWFNVLRLLRRTRRPGAGRMLGAAVGLLAAWYACGLVAFVVFPWVVGLLWLIIESVRG